MVREPLEGSLRNGVEQVALVATTLALTLIGLALAGELLRRGRRAPTLVAVLDRVVPGAARVAAVALIATLPLLAGGRAASADESVGAWLRGSTTTSTTPASTRRAPALTRSTTPTTTATPSPPVASNETIDRNQPSVVLPPLPAPAAPAAPAATAPAPALTPPAEPPTAAPAPERYSVQPGDCLWSIAQRRLPATATNRDIDAGWRQIYIANRAAIGEDPNLIHVGLELELPPLTNLP